MSERKGPSAVRTAGLSALCGYWAWALLSSPDSRVVLEGRLRLPLAGMDIASGVFFLAAPLIVFAAFLGLRSKARTGWPALVLFPAALLLNASRCLALHDPFISYLAAGAAFAGIAWLSWIWASLRPFRRGTATAGKIFAAAGLTAALGIESVLIFFLIPWSLRGDLPGSLNSYPFGPALRSVLYASLAGYERPLGTGAKKPSRDPARRGGPARGRSQGRRPSGRPALPGAHGKGRPRRLRSSLRRTGGSALELRQLQERRPLRGRTERGVLHGSRPARRQPPRGPPSCREAALCRRQGNRLHFRGADQSRVQRRRFPGRGLPRRRSSRTPSSSGPGSMAPTSPAPTYPMPTWSKPPSGARSSRGRT